MISNTAKIAIKTKNLITNGIALFFEPLTEKPTTSFNFSLFPCTSIDMVDSQEFGISFSTTRANISSIGLKSIGGIFLSDFQRCGKTFRPSQLIMLVSVLFCFARVCYQKSLDLCFGFFGITPVRTSSFVATVSIFFISSLSANLAIRMQSIRTAFIMNKEFKRSILPTSNAVFGHSICAYD